jgi:TolB-like protein
VILRRKKVKKAAFLICLLLLAVLPEAAARDRLAVLDFTVESSDPDLKNLGKGFSALIALELDKSQGVLIVKRNTWREVLVERQLSIKDLEEGKVRTLLSDLLDVDYLIYGSISDSQDDVTVRLRMCLGSSGSIVREEELTEKLELYEHISAKLADSVLSYLGARAATATIQNVRFKVARKTEALFAFSEAIAYLDRDDIEQARRALSRAAALAPYADGIRAYLKRLEWSSEVVSPRFRIEHELYSAAVNPAALGFITEGQFYFLFNTSRYNDPENDHIYQAVDGYFVAEDSFVQVLGCLIPLAPGLGLGAEFMPRGGGYSRYLETPFTFDRDGSPQTIHEGEPRFMGGSLSLGYALTDDLSLGTSLLLWHTGSGFDIPDNIFATGINYAVQAGCLLRTWEQQLTVGFSATYTDLAERYVDLDALQVEDGAFPLLLETSLAAVLLPDTLTASLRMLADVFIDGRSGYVLRAIPVLEYRPLAKLFFRAGGEVSRLQLAGEDAAAYGFLGGASVRFGRFGVDANYTVREKPSRLLPGYTLNNRTLYIGAHLKPFSRGLKRSRTK